MCATQPHLPRRKMSAGEFLLPVYRRLLAIAGLTLIFGSTAALAQGGPPAMPVTVAPPVAKRITQWDEFSGRFEPVASVEVRARVSGFIEELHFKDGQLINAGDPLFTIDKRPYEIAVPQRQGRGRAQQGAGRPGRASGPARRLADLLADHHRPGVRPPGQSRGRPRPASLAEAGLRSASSIWNGPRSRRRSPAASPTARSTPAT